MLNGTKAFSESGKWYRGTLHCHTTLSDGPLSPEETIAKYKSLGQDFLSITDHRINGAPLAREEAEFVVLGGAELHPTVQWGAGHYHLVVPQAPADLPVEEVTDVPAAGALSVLAASETPFFIGHPYWCGHDMEEMLPAASLALGVEVYNRTCCGIGRGFSESQWDDLLTRGFALSGIAVDDTHQMHDFGAGVTVVKTSDFSAAGIMKALVEGTFYATTGPAIEEFSVDGDIATIRTDPAWQVGFVATASSGHSEIAPDGETVNRARWKLPEKFSGYVRGYCRAERMRAAWTNPVFFQEGTSLG